MSLPKKVNGYIAGAKIAIAVSLPTARENHDCVMIAARKAYDSFPVSTGILYGSPMNFIKVFKNRFVAV